MEAHLLDQLNQEQRSAVTHGGGPLLIIAGAGTGKTTVVTRRIAHLIQEQGVDPTQILALTFTDKAAGEMEERVHGLLPMGYLDLWISTFHSFCERILKEHALDIGLSNDFRLLSDTEQWLLLREHIDEIELDYYRPKGNPTKFVQALITHFSRLKDEDIMPEEYLAYAEGLQLDTDASEAGAATTIDDAKKAQQDEAQRVMEAARAYHHYQRVLRERNAMDFGDLIAETIHLFKERPAILEKYREQFQYILVDEFQDTNYAQYELIRMLAQPRNNLTVVADDDQSIYSFRGASMSNILIFRDHYPDATNVSLVQNYRSVQSILDLSHAFVSHNNPNRLEQQLDIDKKLQSNKEGDGIIEHLHSQSLEGEASMVVDKMIAVHENDTDTQWSDMAILVRANDHATSFIPYLERAGIPYQFLASQGLFAKPIILDVIAFLKMLDNYHESRALYRVLSYQLWGIDPADLMTILEEGRRQAESLYATCKRIREVQGIQERTIDAIEGVLRLIWDMTKLGKEKTAGEVVLKFLEQSGYLQYVTSQEEGRATEDILYLNQFYKYVEAFERGSLDRSIRHFVQELQMMIDSGEQGRLQPDFDQGPDAVKIMTVHASKGLEFDTVFVVNLVDKRFPSISRRDPIQIPEPLIKDVVPEGDEKQWHLEEERRLFYVAMTRARKRLYFTSGEDYGGSRKKKPSRFLGECDFLNTKPEPTGEVLFSGRGKQVQVSSAEQHAIAEQTTFSFTQLTAYETCGWQYRFAFLLKVPVPGKASFSFGKTIHNTLYEFFRRLKERSELTQGGLFESVADSGSTTAEPDKKELMDIYESKWIGEWFASDRQREEYREKGKQALDAFYDLHVGAWPQVSHLEQGFSLPVGDYTIKGAVDRVDILEDGTAKVVDYKTGKSPKNGKKDNTQLMIYAMALQEVFGLEPSQLEYYFVEDNTALTTDFDPAAVTELQEWIIERIGAIQSGDFTPNPGFHCKYCDFKEICEYRAK